MFGYIRRNFAAHRDPWRTLVTGRQRSPSRLVENLETMEEAFRTLPWCSLVFMSTQIKDR